MTGWSNGVPKDSILEWTPLHSRDTSAILTLLTPKLHVSAPVRVNATINESVRGDDIYVMVDVTNYSLSYPIGRLTRILMSPDDHFQDMKRVIAAVGGKARRVNVIMPYLYESRQRQTCRKRVS